MIKAMALKETTRADCTMDLYEQEDLDCCPSGYLNSPGLVLFLILVRMST